MFNICGDLTVAALVSNKVEKDLQWKETAESQFSGLSLLKPTEDTDHLE